MFPAICFVHYPAIAKIVRGGGKVRYQLRQLSHIAGYFHAVHKIHEGYGYS